MSVCVSTSSASLPGPCPAIDMTMSQMSLGSTAAMMHSIAHQMQQQQHTSPPTTSSSSASLMHLHHQQHPLTLVNGLPSSSSSMDQGMMSSQVVPSDPNEPNPEMILALIARNKALEGEFLFWIKYIRDFLWSKNRCRDFVSAVWSIINVSISISNYKYLLKTNLLKKTYY